MQYLDLLWFLKMFHYGKINLNVNVFNGLCSYCLFMGSTSTLTAIVDFSIQNPLQILDKRRSPLAQGGLS